MNINEPENQNMKNPENEDIQTQDQAGMNDPEVVDDIEFRCLELAKKYINELDDPEQIYDNNGLFVGMLKYIYKYYLSSLLNNNQDFNNRYDYKLLDKLFNIYTSLVYQYKKNKQPYIIEYCIFINIDRSILYSIRNGAIKKASPTDIRNVKRWFSECEMGLLNTDSVGSIFRLKSMFNYNDNLAPVPIELQGQVLSVDKLPDLSGMDHKKMVESKEKKTIKT